MEERNPSRNKSEKLVLETGLIRVKYDKEIHRVKSKRNESLFYYNLESMEYNLDKNSQSQG